LRRSYGGVYDYSTLSLVQQRPNVSRFELSGGFDHVRDRWRELRLRGWFNASERDRLELVSGYSIEDSRWRPMQLRWTHAAPWEIYLALSTTYDLDDEELDRADLEFDWRIDDKWQFAGITTYSGYQDDLDDLSLRLTRDLHCWLASLTYDSDYDEVRLNLGIKAFPFEAQDWTVGRGGARQGSFQQYYY
jgi:lipopolysaccharide assembly outer membrane protein LptD (OstA)